ncbi:MAG: hypothetical protein IKO62_00245 [Bacteroidales bacterium]|nr:hypothetical protein [Bacteroidales bacterium]
MIWNPLTGFGGDAHPSFPKANVVHRHFPRAEPGAEFLAGLQPATS